IRGRVGFSDFEFRIEVYHVLHRKSSFLRRRGNRPGVDVPRPDPGKTQNLVALWPRTGYAEYPMSWTDLKDSPINSAELLRIPPQSGEPWQLHFPISLWRSNNSVRM